MKLTHYSYCLLAAALSISAHRTHAQVKIITTVVGNAYGFGTGIGSYTGDGGLAVNASLSGCTGMTIDGPGNMYIADAGNNVVRKVNTAGIITTFAGNGTDGFGGNGGAATAATFSKPHSVVADASGNIYISDEGNNMVRKVSASGIVSTYAGTGGIGYTGDDADATAATLHSPQGLVIDAAGNLYIADAGNNVIRMVDAAGVITTVAGTGAVGYSGDGGDATAAKLHGASGIAMDAGGNLYIADIYNHVIRKVSTTGTISTYAGTGIPGYYGDGSAAAAARLYFPAGLSVDAGGVLYIADQGNNVIRQVNAGGVISTFAGTHTNGYMGDNGIATACQLNSPHDVYADGWNRIFITDYNNNVIRVVQSSTAGTTIPEQTNGQLVVYPNPSTGDLTVEMPKTNAEATVSIIDAIGRTVSSGNILATGNCTLHNLPAGSYIVRVSSAGNVWREHIVVNR